jgi:hypothetical protein
MKREETRSRSRSRDAADGAAVPALPALPAAPGEHVPWEWTRDLAAAATKPMAAPVMKPPGAKWLRPKVGPPPPKRRPSWPGHSWQHAQARASQQEQPLTMTAQYKQHLQQQQPDAPPEKRRPTAKLPQKVVPAKLPQKARPAKRAVVATTASELMMTDLDSIILELPDWEVEM